MDTKAPFSSADFEAIGRLVVACSDLDAQMTSMIGALAGMHVLDAIITTHHQNFSSKYDCILALLRGIDPNHEIDEDLLKTLTRAKEIYDRRSTLVHALFALDGEQILAARFQARGRLKMSQTTFDRDEVLSTAHEAEQLSAWLDRARAHFLSEDSGPKDRYQ